MARICLVAAYAPASGNTIGRACALPWGRRPAEHEGADGGWRLRHGARHVRVDPAVATDVVDAAPVGECWFVLGGAGVYSHFLARGDAVAVSARDARRRYLHGMRCVFPRGRDGTVRVP
jgi:hypothetical protein